MSELKCPGCGGAMKSVESPDIIIDRCEACGGTWLDQGELNTLATGLAGNIEFCSAEHQIFDEAAPERQCPVCAKPMLTVNLVGTADIVLDHCQECLGFYLDRGEVESMNESLRHASRAAKGDEYRGEIDGLLVRVDRNSVTSIRHDVLGLGYVPMEEQTLLITVFFAKPVGQNLRIFHETVSAKLAKALHLFAPQDWDTGDSAFDKAFIVQGDDPAALKKALGSTLRQALLQFNNDEPKVYAKPGTIEVLDNRVVYTEGPYAVDEESYYASGLTYDPEQDPADIVRRLMEIAKALV